MSNSQLIIEPSQLISLDLMDLVKKNLLANVVNCYKPTSVWETKEELKWLSLLASNKKAQEQELLLLRRNPLRFIRLWCRTIDTHDRENPIKFFPDKVHILTLICYWMSFPRLLIPKSRQMMMTWLFCSLYLWDSIFYPHRLTFFQSKKEIDANENVERTFSVWKNLPIWMKEWCPVTKTFCRLTFDKNGSRVIGIPSGADHARQYTSSSYFSDEIAFQSEVDSVMAAVGPTLTGGGRFTGLSSATASYFKLMLLDQV